MDNTGGLTSQVEFQELTVNAAGLVVEPISRVKFILSFTGSTLSYVGFQFINIFKKRKKKKKRTTAAIV